MEEKTKTPFWKPALIYGAIVGFVGILVGVIFYVMDLAAASWSNWINMLIGLVVLIYCMVAYRKEYLGGFATFGQIFKMTLVVGIIATLITTIYTYILMGVIDPELPEKMRIAAEEKMLNNPRIPEAYMDTAIERLAKNFEVKRMVIMGILSGPIVYSILGLIIGAFVKKENPINKVV